MNTLTERRVQRVRHELKRRHLTVTQVDHLSPHVRRIHFTGESLADFVSASFDDHVKLILNADSAQPIMRDYTPRHFDTTARHLSIEFALHGTGPAAQWAAQARPGDTVVVGGPRGSFIVPTDYDWHLLVGDDTALPAIQRRLDELPATTQAVVVAQVAHAEDRPALHSAAQLSLHWVNTEAELLTTVAALPLPAGEGYAWGAGEARLMAELRRLLVGPKGLNPQQMRVAAYWKRGTSAHHENLEA